MVDRILVTGSTAIDQTGLFAGSFETYQARYPIKALNMSLPLGGMRTSFGGCAPNIAYGLNLLGVAAIPLSSAGRNFRDQYEDHLRQSGINIDYIAVDDSVEHCASCMMFNDSEGNQIIGFYPGPGTPLRKLPSEIPEIDEVRLVILGPEAPALTLKQARDVAALDIPVMFDPGQVISDFSREALLEMLSLASILIVNDYEFRVLLENSELDAAAVLNWVDEVVVTRGSQGADIHQRGDFWHVDAIADVEVVEVTGCGDAFRAGYAYGVLKRLSPDQRGQLGCVMAMLNLVTEKTQNYHTSLAEVLALRDKHYD